MNEQYKTDFKKLGGFLQQAIDRYLSIFGKHYIDQMAETESRLNKIKTLDTYWVDKEDILRDMATQKSITTAYTFLECLHQISQDVYEGVMLESQNKEGLRKFKVFLLKRGWI